MNYSVIHATPETIKTACIIVGIYSNQQLSNAAQRINTASDGQFENLLKLGGMDGDSGRTLLLLNVPGIAAQRVLAVGCGKPEKTTASEYRKVFAHAASALASHKIEEAISFLTEIQVPAQTTAWHIQQGILAVAEQQYNFREFKSEKNKKTSSLKKLVLASADAKTLKQDTQIAKRAQAIAAGIRKTRDLGNLPSNICTPGYLAKQAQTLSRQNPKLKVQVLSATDIKKLGMGAFLAVAKGSDEPAKFIVIQFLNGKAKAAPAVLVGKGITFDTGGISLKPPLNMDEMKYDMCGAATVIGVLSTCAEINLPINLIGIIATTENMPSGHATKPGDIITSMSGTSIEILNTDAEGRLILCDALTYAERFKPSVVIDIATLTGACVIALGRNPSGLYSNHQPLANHLIQAGETSGDRVWQMPLWDEYQEQLKSNFADIANIGGTEAGSVTAACFLSRFTQKYHWAHLDIAGTAWKTGAQKGSTGRPVSLLMQYLIDHHAG